MAFDSPQPTSTNRQAEGGVRLCAHVASLTDIGRRRKNNEDSHLVFPLDGGPVPQIGEQDTIGFAQSGLLLAVADGMGGHAFGEVASRECIEHLAKEIVTQLGAAGAIEHDLSLALRKAVEVAHEGVYSYSQQSGDTANMGTTLTAALLNGTRADVAQVGDSRAYLFRDGNLFLLTEDQTIGNLLRSRGEEYDQVGNQIREMLTQAVGAQREIEVVMTSIGLELGDALLLCSDGLYKAVSPGEIVDCLEQDVSPGDKARSLVMKANENGGPDNVTVILAEICPFQTTLS